MVAGWEWPALALVVIVAACVGGLAIELVRAALRTRSRGEERRLLDDRPPDHRVDVVVVPHVHSEPNASDGRFQRFTGLEQAVPASIRGTGHVAPPLLGKVVIFNLFLDRFGRGWSDGEIAQVHASLWRMGVWLERQASRWSAPVNLALADTYWTTDDDDDDEVEVVFGPEGDRIVPQEGHAAQKALIRFSRAAARLGFADAADLIGQMSARMVADCWVWLIHPRCAGQSIAVPADLTPWPGVTLAVCYAREESFPGPLSRVPSPDPVTYAHELLHLFGATDKYEVPRDRYPAGSLSEHDIMRLDYDSLSRLRVDRATAAELGWANPQCA